MAALVKSSNLNNILIFFDGKSLFEMTVDRNKNIAGQVMVVGNMMS
jgi:mannose-1-phosphate guanylyltransferase